ncbi:MAG: transglutaminase domain-containing protein [Ruminococcaceae bacterium]|nr:transglutaminase domain-containing protein [Oscillospiraceae bacterium]
MPSVSVTDPGQTELVAINTLQELIDHLNQQREQGVWVSTVRYSGTLSQQEIQLLSGCVGAAGVECSIVGDEHTFTLMQFPGHRIVQAHASGDTSQLTADEVQALGIAEQMVAQARAQTSDPLELELLLYDMLRERTTYYNEDTDRSDEDELPRYRTAVGALVDGRANCQGCADGFYTLACLAGFRVDRMSGLLNGEPHEVNTIYLDGAWYVVDATATLEQAKGAEQVYPRFNAGVDMCGSLSWSPEQEIKPIAPLSDRHYYYNIQNDSARHNYQKKYTDLTELTQAAVREFDVNGREVVYLMLLDRQATQEEIGQALRLAGQEAGRSFSASYSQSVSGNHTYITFGFSE